MFKSTIQVTLFSILSILINFIVQLLLAYFFGASEERDAYFVALTIPTYISVLFTGSIGMLLIPFLVKFSTLNPDKKTFSFTSSVINFCGLVLIVLALLAVLFSDPIMRVMVPTNKPGLLENAIQLFRILMFSILFTVLNNLLSSIFQARHSFLIPSQSVIVTNITVLIFVGALSPSIGISSIAYGTLCGGLISFVFLLTGIIKKFRYRWRPYIMSTQLRAIVWTSLPLFGAGILFRSATVFERYFAARLPEGSLTYLGNANQVIVILSTLVSAGIATTSFPLLSKHWSEKDLEGFEKTLAKVINLITIIVFPLIVIFIACGKDFIKIVFQHGAFRPADSLALYYTLLGLMGFFLFTSMGNVIARILYISHFTKAAAIIGSLELAVYIMSAVILGGLYGYVGLAVSMSIGGAFNIIVSLIYIRKKIIPIKLTEFAKRIGLITIVSVIVLLPVFLLNKYWFANISGLLRCIITPLLVGGLFWLVLVKVLKDKYYISVIQLIRNKIQL